MHAGVPYGRNFDWQRLISSFCLDRDGQSLAITDKGRTAAEMLVFARYIMFSEVYWHHAVRAATAMLQRAFYELHEFIDLSQLFESTDVELVELLYRASRGRPTAPLIEGLFGPRRILYKRWLEFSCFSDEVNYRRFAQQPYFDLLIASDRLAERLSQQLHREIPSQSVLLDAPPADLEIQFDLDVRTGDDGKFRKLAQLSPVVNTLATHQFDDYVKKVRVFVASDIRDELSELAAGSKKIGAEILDGL